MLTDLVWSTRNRFLTKQISNLEEKVRTLKLSGGNRVNRPPQGGGYGDSNRGGGGGRGKNRGRGNGAGGAKVASTGGQSFFEIRKTICKFWNEEKSCFKKEK